MPEHIKALIIILASMTVAFLFASPRVFSGIPAADFKRRRNGWIFATVTLFVFHDFWLYVLFTSLVILVCLKNDGNKVALFLFLLFVIPPIQLPISGFGIVNFLFALDQFRFLALVIFLPMLFRWRDVTKNHQVIGSSVDRLLYTYLFVLIILQSLVTTFTDTARQAFYLFIDIFLPYFLSSRVLTSKNSFRDALASFTVAATILAAIAPFEMVKSWSLYTALTAVMDVPYGLGGYLLREGDLRAAASTGQPIVLGYVLVVAMGFLLYCRTFIKTRVVELLWFATLVTGLISTLSRGPWIGALILIVTFFLTGPSPLKKLAMISALGTTGFAIAAMSPYGEKLIGYLPFVGNVESENITYRQILIDNCLTVLLQNPLFGVPDAMNSAVMQGSKNGAGIIDIVNTYLSIGLSSGLVGITLFISIFGCSIYMAYRGMRFANGKDEEMVLLGRVLIAVMVSILIMIGTVSSISSVPIIYWTVAGMSVAYSRFVHQALTRGQI